MSKRDCDIYGCDDNGFAEDLASRSLVPSKPAVFQTDSPTRGAGEGKGNLSDASHVPNKSTTKVTLTNVGTGQDSRKGSKGNS